MEVAKQLNEILGPQYPIPLILQVISTHNDPNNIDSVMDTLLNLNINNNKQENEVPISDSTNSSSSEDEGEFEDDEAVNAVEKEMQEVKEGEYRQTAQAIIEILGDMYPFEQVLEVVRNHPQNYNLEVVMDAVLDSINIRTVSNHWISKIRDSGGFFFVFLEFFNVFFMYFLCLFI